MKLSLSVLFVMLVVLLKGQPVFDYSPPKDIVLLGSGMSLSLGSYLIGKNNSPVQIDELPLLSKEDIPRFDRGATENWSPLSARASDVGLLMCVGAPAFLLLSGKARDEFGVVALMGAETMLLTTSFTLFAKNITQRKRPYVYNNELTDDIRTNADSKKSFFSGHTSLAFASVVFASSVYSQYYPNSKLKPFVWGSGLALAGGVGYLRYSAGKHFPSDILTGAVVGSAIGYIVPRIHRVKTKQSSTKSAFTVRFIFAI